ncbi:MAG: hypothetical protein Q8P30_04920 [Candidatus Uhrbacteria bacterium]|nr:hypothetical protein [Candidatus Uhrbacteria bacterium]
MPTKKVSSTATKVATNKKTTVAKKPIVKKSVEKPAKKKVVKSVVKKKTAVVNMVQAKVKPLPTVCRACHSLPAGTVEIVTLMLVMTFALTAVLLTSVYALNQQSHQIEVLEAKILSQK